LPQTRKKTVKPDGSPSLPFLMILKGWQTGGEEKQEKKRARTETEVGKKKRKKETIVPGKEKKISRDSGDLGGRDTF